MTDCIPPPADPHVCARCAAVSPTCCVASMQDIECCFALNLAEREAIEAYTKQHSPDLQAFTQTANTPAFRRSMQALFPQDRRAINRLFPAGGKHYRLSVDEQGACRLLGPQGCMLPRTTRPLYCRIFPFWIQEDGLWHFAKPDCLAQQENIYHNTLLLAFDLAMKDVASLHKALRKGWGLDSD